jgi:serine/threonine protein kinase/tetratricopeptide (TPR) repeat protein
MTPERYEQIGRLYHAALEHEPLERMAFLAKACGTDEDLYREVASLLAAHEKANNFIEQPPSDVAAGWQAASGPLPDRSFGQYQMLSLLGRGGMGEVWLAKDPRLGRRVALKLLPAEFTADAERVPRFAQEARAASALNHPNIITIYEIGEIQNTHYIATEYVEGETLRRRMDRGSPMTVQEALDVTLQVAGALEAAHRAGIIHRDIKPENLMVRPDGYVKVLDFGLAKLVEPATEGLDATRHIEDAVNTESGVVMGTPRSMSPEQARGEKADARTDIFSLGVVFYQMVTGRQPFTGATRNDIIASILKDKPPPLTTVAPEMLPALGRIIGKALEKDREARYQSVQDLISDLKQLQRDLEFPSEEMKRSSRVKVGGEETSAIPLSGEISRPRSTAPEGETTKKIVNRRRFAALGALVGLVIAATAGWFYISRSPALTSKDAILLADFENKTGEEVFDDTLKQGLAIQVQQSPFLNLFPEARVQQTLSLMGRSPDERLTVALARAICERDSIKALIRGSIAPLGSHYVIMLEAINGLSGEVLAREQIEAESREQVLRALSRVMTQLRTKLGESLGSIRQHDRIAEDATTPKLEAFKFYTQGSELAISGRGREAIPLLKRAVEIDPDFAYAWSLLSVMHGFTGRPGQAAEYAGKAYALKERVGEYEKLRITYWYHVYVTGDLDKVIEVLMLQKQMYPRKWAGLPVDFAAAYFQTGQYDQAVAAAREGVSIFPSFAIGRGLLAQALLRLNRFTEAKDTLAPLAFEQKIDATYFRSYLYELAFIEGDSAAMQQQLDWATGKPNEYVAFDWQAAAVAFAGQWHKAQVFSRRALDMTARGETKEVAAGYAAKQALRLAVWSSYFSLPSPTDRTLKLEIQTLVRTALSLARGRASLPRAALALALCGRSAQAKPLVDELAKLYPQDTIISSIWLPVIHAAKELQRGNAEAAIEQLQATSRYEPAAEFWPQYLRGEAYLKLKHGTEAAAEFQRILDHRGQAPLSVLYPLAHLGLARGLALGGDTEKSRKSYEDFFAAWKEADPALPVLTQANSEYEKQLVIR